MLNGDISNVAGITIAFRCEDFLIKYKESSFLDSVLNTFIGKLKRAEIDENVRSVMEYLYRNTPYNVDLVVEEHSYNQDMKNILDDLPFNRVVVIKKLSQIATRLNTGDITYYVDDNQYRLSLVNSKFAIKLSELYPMIRRGGTFGQRYKAF